MAKFLDTMDVTCAIMKIIKSAQERVVLISPYLDISEEDKVLIKKKNDDQVLVKIIYGKKKNQFKLKEIKEWIKSMKFVSLEYHKELHAKCYLNENEAVITSMNLYTASEKNIEMGVLLTKEIDREAYNDLWNNVKKIIEGNEGKPNIIVIHKVPPIVDKWGYCIRCGNKIKMDPASPYCLKDYTTWKRIKNKAYVEKTGVCHICGKPNDSSMEKPICINCLKK